jgi:beta-N-acetylhexosaminidase
VLVSVLRPCLLCLALAAAVTAHVVDLGAARTAPTLAQLVGQKLVVSMDGKAPSTSLLARARRGQIGGVIIHSWNFTTAASLRSVASRLQQAAAVGGQPPLLIGVDQEGGPVKTVPWIPPSLSPRQLGELHSGTKANRQGQATGRALRSLGVNLDFAPLADVPGSAGSFLYRQGRTWSFAWHPTARLSGWFAIGLGQTGVIATAKHFPGLGLAEQDTDRSFVRITATRAELASGLKPFKTSIADRVPLIMLSNALYTAYDGGSSAGWSRAIGTKLLRKQLGFRGATITDSLDGAAHARHLGSGVLAVRAARAGTDLLLLTGGERGSQSAYRSLLAAASSGRIDQARLLASYERIQTLKALLRPRASRTRTARAHA